MSKIYNFILILFFVALATTLTSCSDNNDDVRTPADIVGVWSPSDNVYLDFSEDNTIRNVRIEVEDGETVGVITDDVYFYEPGYNLVVYITAEQTANVYQIVSMTDKRLTWCWVKDITDKYDGEVNIGSIIGEIIKEAQEGFKLDPGHYQSFNKISEDKFLEILESLDLLDSWW